MKLWLARKVLSFVRWYYTGRTAIWLTEREGLTIIRAEGKFVSGKLSDRGLTMLWQVPGRPITELKRVSAESIHYDLKLKSLVFCTG